jgi:uncharacterized membrane protein
VRWPGLLFCTAEASKSKLKIMKKHVLYLLAGAFWLMLAMLQYSEGNKRWPGIVALLIGLFTFARGIYFLRQQKSSRSFVS